MELVVVFSGFDQLIHISPYRLYIFGIRVTWGFGWLWWWLLVFFKSILVAFRFF